MTNHLLSMLLLICSSLLPGLACICLAYSQEQHALVIFGRHAPLPRAANCKRWAWLFLFVSLVCSILYDGGDFAIILWPLYFGAGAVLVVVMLAYRPGGLRFLAVLPGVR